MRLYQPNQAMAVPAAMPEFKGNVIAVLTEKCWDAELGAVATKLDKIKNKARALCKKGGISREE